MARTIRLSTPEEGALQATIVVPVVFGDDGETLGWNTVAFRSIPVTTKGNAQFAFVVRG